MSSYYQRQIDRASNAGDYRQLFAIGDMACGTRGSSGESVLLDKESREEFGLGCLAMALAYKILNKTDVAGAYWILVKFLANDAPRLVADNALNTIEREGGASGRAIAQKGRQYALDYSSLDTCFREGRPTPREVAEAARKAENARLAQLRQQLHGASVADLLDRYGSDGSLIARKPELDSLHRALAEANSKLGVLLSSVPRVPTVQGQPVGNHADVEDAIAKVKGAEHRVGALRGEMESMILSRPVLFRGSWNAKRRDLQEQIDGAERERETAERQLASVRSVAWEREVTAHKLAASAAEKQRPALQTDVNARVSQFQAAIEQEKTAILKAITEEIGEPQGERQGGA